MKASKWTVDRIEVTAEKIVLDLRENGTLVDRYTLHQDGRFVPFQPCKAARDLLIQEAVTLRGWKVVDGWKVLERNGHVVTVRKAAGDGFRYEYTFDGRQDEALVNPGDDLFTLLAALENAVATLSK